MRISETGISLLRGMPKIIKVLADVEGSSDARKSKRRLEIAEREAALAQTEVDTDFPVLHGFVVIALWGGLERFTKDLVALWLRHRKDALRVPAVARLKVKLGEYLPLSHTEKARYLVELIEQDMASLLRRGVSRFESLLEPFSLGGPLPDGCAKTLFELQQVRNVVAHRNGIADRRLRSECPWLKVKLNQPVLISRQILDSYFESCMRYALTVFYRIGDAYGQDLRPENVYESSLGTTNHVSDTVGC